MSDVKFSCPSCGQHIKCDESHVGANIPCPGCAHLVRVPANAALVLDKPIPVNPMAVPTLDENFAAQEDAGAALPSNPPVTEREQQIAAARAARAQSEPAIKPRLSFILSGGEKPPPEENESAVTTAGQIHSDEQSAEHKELHE